MLSGTQGPPNSPWREYQYSPNSWFDNYFWWESQCDAALSRYGTVVPAAEDPIVAPLLDVPNGLRGIGSIMIVMGHFFGEWTPTQKELFPIYAPEYFSMVTLFFVISGFTLTCVYNNSNTGVGINTVPFLQKRLARLAPIYYTSLIPAIPPLYVYTTDTYILSLTICSTILWFQALVVQNKCWNAPWHLRICVFLWLLRECVSWQLALYCFLFLDWRF